MAKLSDKRPTPNRAIVLTIEKINNGFVVIELTGVKTWKASLNGVLKHLEQAFGVEYVETTSSPKTNTTVEDVLKKDDTIAQSKSQE